MPKIFVSLNQTSNQIYQTVETYKELKKLVDEKSTMIEFTDAENNLKKLISVSKIIWIEPDYVPKPAAIEEDKSGIALEAAFQEENAGTSAPNVSKL